MNFHCKPLSAALLAALSAGSLAQKTPEAPVKTLGTVTVTSGQPRSPPTQIPTTIEGITGKQIEETINATDSEDVLKYFPSLNVRKRYIGDYHHAVLASRASGTGNSARSLVYADGILLSSLLGNGAFYTPRWGLITPEEIERVDVLYGPYWADKFTDSRHACGSSSLPITRYARIYIKRNSSASECAISENVPRPIPVLNRVSSLVPPAASGLRILPSARPRTGHRAKKK